MPKTTKPRTNKTARPKISPEDNSLERWAGVITKRTPIKKSGEPIPPRRKATSVEKLMQNNRFRDIDVGVPLEKFVKPDELADMTQRWEEATYRAVRLERALADLIAMCSNPRETKASIAVFARRTIEHEVVTRAAENAGRKSLRDAQKLAAKE